MANIQKRDSFRIALARCIRYGAASVKVPVRLALIGGLSFGVAAGIATFAAGSFFTNLIQQARDVYTVYRLTGERDELRVSNDRLEQRVAAIQREYQRKAEFQREAKSKLESLHKALASAGALSLFGKGEPKTDKNKKRSEPLGSGSQSDPSTLAQVMRSPLLAGKRKEPAVVDDAACKPGSECVHKRNIALSVEDDTEILVGPSTEEESAAEVLKDEQMLLEALEFYTAAVEKTPIGAPVLGRYSSGFGFRSSPFSNRRSFHEGIDISLPRGGKVSATGAGVVKKVGYHNHYGLSVDIEHTPEITTRYAHLSKTFVKVGQVVDRGQRIGLSGSSGRVTGPHVHYEVIHKGSPKNPKPFVALADSLPDVL